MKYRPPRWHHTLRAIFDDYETETQAKIISLIESSFVDEDQASYVSSSDNGFDTPSSNNVEDVDDSSGEVGSASALDSLSFSPSQESTEMIRRRVLQLRSKESKAWNSSTQRQLYPNSCQARVQYWDRRGRPFKYRGLHR
jgi:hypothetical protein